jgi:uracil-DNA glycosylase family 4
MVSDGILAKSAARFGYSPEDYVTYLMNVPSLVHYHTPSGADDQYKSICPHVMSGKHGPQPADVLVIGKSPNVEELDSARLHSGNRGKLWKDMLDRWGVDYSSWMAANVCWWWTDLKTYPAVHFKEWQHALARTINIVRPKYMLLFGKDALKFTYKLTPQLSVPSFSNARGAVMDYAGGIKTMVCTSPANVYSDPTSTGDFIQDMTAFCRLTSGGNTAVSHPRYEIIEIDHQADLDKWVDQMIAENRTHFAIDFEWGNGDWLNGQLRTMQIAWSNHQAVIIILRRQGMKEVFNPSIASASPPLSRLFYRPGVTLCGHNIRGDLKWSQNYLGLDLMPFFINGGRDTMLMHHLLYETSEQQLELCALRMLGMERYDMPLRKWLIESGMTKDDKNELGYGYVPDGILHPYAGMDAIATWALDEVLVPELKKWPGLWELYQNYVHPVNTPLMEMEMNGVLIDMAVVRQQVDLIQVRQAELLAELKSKFNWPGFNPRSPLDVRELLFSISPIKNGVPVKVSPHGAVNFKLSPLKATDKTKGMIWEKVMRLQPNEREKHSPSTDQETVAILSADCPPLNTFRQFKTVDQLKKNFLRPQDQDLETGEFYWEKGIGSWVSFDGRLHTNFRQTLETGRYATSPNLQNWPKKTEKDIQKCFMTNALTVVSKDENDLPIYWANDHWSLDRAKAHAFFNKEAAQETASKVSGEVIKLLDPRYRSLRSVIIATPGTVLVEPDWNQAELWTLGALSGDQDFLHVLATSDLHTEMLIKMFGSLLYQGKAISTYTAGYLKKAAKKDKYLDALRTCAKTVNFGIPYGRGAAAIIREIKKEGVRDRTNQEAQGWIDTFFATFPKVYAYLEWCKQQVTDPRYITNPYKRYRRFPFTTEDDLIADYQREAVNFPIQSTVGDSMSGALINFWNYRRYINPAIKYDLLLSIHDAVLLQVPYAHVAGVVEEVIPSCMVNGLEVPGCGLHYGIGDIDIQLRWGERADPNELLSLGVPRPHCGFKKQAA